MANRFEGKAKGGDEDQVYQKLWTFDRFLDLSGLIQQ
jgi:hypothetical protein